MPERRDPPPTDEGWYALHDFRTIDWDAWRDATERDREHALDEATGFLESALAVEDADEGASALYSILGHGADILVLHLRPSTADLGALERRFETTDFAGYTDRIWSFVSVTEASGYSEQARGYFEGEDVDAGLANYIETRLKPTIPDAAHVCFYPMDKRRDPEQNWYDLPFEERAEHMHSHGEIGRKYGGRIVQMITGAIALDDWEWGVTLWGDDPVDMKELLYEMRFDPSTSRYAEFGSFYLGRHFPPADLPALLAGERVPTDGESDTTTGPTTVAETTSETGTASEPAPVHPADTSDVDDHDPPPSRDADGDVEHTEEDDLAGRLSTLGFQEGEDYDAGDYGLVLYADADAAELVEKVDGMRGNFEHYDSHVLTAVRAHGGQSVVVSVWNTERAADTAEGFLIDLPGVTRCVRGPIGEDGDTTTNDAKATANGAEGIREELAELEIYAGTPHGEDVYALVVYSRADPETLRADVEELREGFDRYETHEGTDVYTDPDSETAAVVSLWATESAADTASDYLAELPDISGWGDTGDGFATMGMFYTVQPEHRGDFVEKFGTVGELLDGMDGHRETALLANVEDENDMFIASRWDSKGDAMEFFRSDAFSETVDWGRDILADRPRHVFLA